MLRLARLPISGYETLDKDSTEMGAPSPPGEEGQEPSERVNTADIKSLEILYKQVTEVVGRRLPPSTLSVLAQPSLVEGDTHVDWLTELEGQPQRLDQLKEEEQNAALALLQERLTAIDALADTIAQEDEEVSHLAPKLKRATQFPGLEDILVVSGNPIILFWGHRRSGVTPLGPRLKSTASSGDSEISPVGTNGQGRFRVLLWIGVVLLLLALCLGALWWILREPDEYNILLARLSSADCDELADIIQLASARTDDKRYQSIVERAEKRVETCEYQRVAALLDDAAGDCGIFRRLNEAEPALSGQDPLFQPLRVRLSTEIATCEYDRIAQAVADSKDNCPASADLLTNEPLLQTKEARYETLLSALEVRMIDCDFTRVQQAIENSKASCDQLNDLKTNEPLLSPPEGQYVALAERLEGYLENCSVNETLNIIENTSDECQKALANWKTSRRGHAAFYVSDVSCGWSWNYSSAQGARDRAQRECLSSSKGNKCVPITNDVINAQ